MSYPVYYVPAGDVVPILFDTFDGGTGASVTMSGLAVTDIEVYRDGSTTQRASDAGFTLLDTDGIDFDGTTGIHGFSIDTGDNTDASFYTVGSWFHVVVSSVTVDGQTVNFIAAAFRIMAAEAIAGKPKADVDAWLGTAAATPTVAGVPEVDVTHIAGSTTDVSTIPASVAAILVDTGTTLQGELDGIQADTEDIQSRLPAALVGGRIDATVDGTGLEAAAAAVIADAVWDEAATGHTDAGKAGEQLWTDVDAILTDTGTTLDGKLNTIDGIVDDILVDTAEIGAAGAGLTEAGGTGDHLTAVPWNAAWDAEVESEVDDALGGGTGTALTGIPWNAAWDAEVQSEVQDALDATLADSVPSDGTRPSLAQAAYAIYQFLTERAVSGTTLTVNKVDGSTQLMVFTLDDASNPTSITRAS